MNLITKEKISNKEYDMGMAVMKRCLVQIVYPVIECADLEASEAMEYLKKNDLYKFKLKHLAIEARNDLSKAVKRCQRDCDADFIEEFATRIENSVYDDIKEIRGSISKIMVLNKYKYHSTMCRVETVSVLLQVAIMAFDRIKEKNYRRTGFRFDIPLSYFRVGDVFKSWQRIGDEFYHLTIENDFDLNSYKKPKELLDKFYTDLFGSDLITKTMKEVVEEYK